MERALLKLAFTMFIDYMAVRGIALCKIEVGTPLRVLTTTEQFIVRDDFLTKINK